MESSEDKRKIEPMHTQPDFYPTINVILVAMNDKVRKNLNIAELMDH